MGEGVPTSHRPGSVWVKEMKAAGHKRYRSGSYLLIGFASLLLLAALLTDPQGYMQSPLLMLGAAGFISGFFLFALSGDEGVDARLASYLSLQGISALSRIIHDHGGCGTAIFLPPDGKDGKVMQFIPMRPNRGSSQGDGAGFACHNGSFGTLNSPLAGPILEELKYDNDLVLPSEYGLLMGAIREVCEDLLLIARRVDIKKEEGLIIISLNNYILFPGCASRSEATPESCVLCPCSICSLIACMIAEGLGCEVSLNRVVLDDTRQSLSMEISCASKNGAKVVQTPEKHLRQPV